MRCSRCRKPLKKAYMHKGRIYGPECVLRAGGSITSSKRVTIKDGKEKDKQLDLFR